VTETLVRVIDRLLEWSLPPGARGATIRGDLFEECLSRRPGGVRRAEWWYIRAAVPIVLRYALVRNEDGSRRTGRQGSVEALMQDFRYASRNLRRAPAFTAAVVTTMALGLGAAVGIFSVFDAVVLKPLALPRADRLVFIGETRVNGDRMSVAWPDFVDWQQRTHTLEDLAASRFATFTLTGVEEPEHVPGRQITWNFLRVLGVHPALGRDFTENDDRPGGEHTVLLSDAFWRRRFGGSAAVLGHRITLDGEPHLILGVLPRGFRYITAADVYEPYRLGLTPKSSALDRGNHQGLYAVGRLRPGVTVEAARTEFRGIADSLARQYPASSAGDSARLNTLTDEIVGDVRPAIFALFGAVTLLLLIACVNVANLLLARAVSRQHELSVRAALGGGRVRLIRLLLVESLILAVAGGVLGTLAGTWLVHVLIGLAPAGTPRIDEVRVNGAVLTFAGCAALGCGLLFGLLPALHASGSRGTRLLARSVRGGVSAPHRLRRTLLVAELSLALTLLAGAGLMVRTLQHVHGIDPGFDPTGVLTLHFSLEGPQWTADRLRAFYGAFEEQAAALPEVRSAALADSLPVEGSNWNSVFVVAGQPVPRREDLPSAAFVPVSPSYFSAVGTHLIAGRAFTGRDDDRSQHAAIVSESFARHFWPGGDAIVGIAEDTKFEGVISDYPMTVYLPLAQNPDTDLAVVVRTSGPPERVSKSLIALLRTFDRDVAPYDVRTLESRMQDEVARQRMSMFLLSLFAAIALILAAVGVYGVISQGVSERAREIGVRLALGARPSAVLRMFVRQGVAVALAGAALGAVAAALLSRFLKTLLFQVQPTDAATFSVVTALLVLVAAAACYVPARRATRIDPAAVLRGD
jgi:putative ABC transport system permease protein